MGLCFSKPDKKQLLGESRERVDNNARVLSVCVELAEDDTELEQKVTAVYDSVKFMTPSAASAVAQADKKIYALAGDLKIALTKGRDRDKVHAEAIIRDIEVAVAERISYTK